MNAKMEEMLRAVEAGSTADEAVRQTLGNSVKASPEKLRKMIQMLNADAGQLEAVYSGIAIKNAVLSELERQSGDDNTKFFHRISDVKYCVNMQNLELSHQELTEKGVNREFLKEIFAAAYEEEQKLEDVTEEELEAVKKELVDALPEDGRNSIELLRHGVQDEQDAALLKKVKEAMQQASEKHHEDFAVIAAAAFLSEHPEIPMEVAAATAAVHTAQSTGRSREMFFLAMETSLAVMVSGHCLMFAAELAGISVLSSAGMILWAGGAVALGAVVILAAGVLEVGACKKLAAIAQRAWLKCKPYVVHVAAKVKRAALSIFGIIRDKVFRPVIYWTVNKAAPAIRDWVVYPIKRRLQGLLEWLKEKKDQVAEFFRNTVAPQTKEEDAQREEGSIYDMEEDESEDEDEIESNFVYA